jgi:hypothetical protein
MRSNCCLLFAPCEFYRGLVTVQENSSLRIKQPDGVDATLEKAPEHGATVPEQLPPMHWFFRPSHSVAAVSSWVLKKWSRAVNRSI